MSVFSVDPNVAELEEANQITRTPSRFTRYRIRSLYSTIEFIVQNLMQERVNQYVTAASIGYVEREVWNRLFPSTSPYTFKQTRRNARVNGRKVQDIIEHVKFNIYYGFPTLNTSLWFVKEYTNQDGIRTRLILQEIKFIYNSRTHFLKCGFAFWHHQWNGTMWISV